MVALSIKLGHKMADEDSRLVVTGRKEGNVLFNDTLILIRSYGVGHMVMEREREDTQCATIWDTLSN